MSIRRTTIIALIGLTLAGCGGAAVIQKRQAEYQQAGIQIRGQFAAAHRDCQAEMDSHDLDPIRNKVELIKASQTAPTPFAMLIINTTPTEEEQVAITKWADARERCLAMVKQVISALALPLSMPANFQQQMKSGMLTFADEATRAVNFLIAGLYSAELTYAEFNKRRGEVDDKLSAGFNQWMRAMDAENTQRVVAEAQAAQQQFEAFVGLVQAIGCAKAKGAYAQALCR